MIKPNDDHRDEELASRIAILGAHRSRILKILQEYGDEHEIPLEHVSLILKGLAADLDLGQVAVNDNCWTWKEATD